MRTGRPIPPLTLTVEERETLEHWIRRAKTGQALAQRCRVIVGCAAGKSKAVVAAEMGLCPQTVGKWRARFLEQRLEGPSREGLTSHVRALRERSPMLTWNEP